MEVTFSERAYSDQVANTPPTAKRHPKVSSATKQETFKRQLFKHDDSLARAVNGELTSTPVKSEYTPQRFANTAEKENAGTPRTDGRPSSARKLQFANESERLKAFEDENARLREALKQLKSLMASQAQLVVNSAAIVSGAKKYVNDKSMSSQKLTPQKRYGSAVSVQITGTEIVSSHVEYILEVRFGEDSGHAIRKRYSEFLGLRQRVLIAADAAARSESCSFFGGYGADEVNIQTLNMLRSIHLPQKKWFSNLDPVVIEKRTQALQEYLDAALKACKRAGRGAIVRSVVSDWLGIHRNDEDSVWCDDRIKPLAEFDSRARQARVSEAFETLLTHTTPMRRTLADQIQNEYEPSSLRKMTRATTSEEEDIHLL